ncbi:MAG TPA: pitrilysin family protein, partial [Gaiellaceae bacterium]|nr:pitrilysin family protein [Gaiellaceae bacterium]
MTVYQRNALSNGLRVLTAPLDHAQSVTCYIMLAAGSRYENAGNRGIAHFAEHMFFKGTERRPTAKDIALEVDRFGGEFNAFTSKEYTGYFIRCAGEQRDQALDVLVDMIRNSKFESEELEREKGVIVEEMNMYFDTPRDYVSSVYDELLFGDNPLGWETLGTKETVTGATRDTFLDYISEWYKPERMVVGVAGMTGDDLLPRLEDLLGDIETADTGKPAPSAVERSPEPRVRIHSKDSDQANVCLGLPSYPLDHPDRYALQLLGTVLGTGMSSRLFLEVRERRGLAYYVYALNSSFTDAGTLVSQAGVDLKRADEAVGVIANEFKRLAQERVPEDELEKARALSKGRFVL